MREKCKKKTYMKKI